MDIAIELENFHAAKIELVRLMTDEFRRGTSAAEVARALSSAFSRDVVTQYLGTIDRFDRATTALAENDLDGIAGAWYTGIAAPRETRLALSIGPEEVADHAVALVVEVVAEDDLVVPLVRHLVLRDELVDLRGDQREGNDHAAEHGELDLREEERTSDTSHLIAPR